MMVGHDLKAEKSQTAACYKLNKDITGRARDEFSKVTSSLTWLLAWDILVMLKQVANKVCLGWVLPRGRLSFVMPAFDF